MKNGYQPKAGPRLAMPTTESGVKSELPKRKLSRECILDNAVRRFPHMIKRVKATDMQGCGITIHPGEAEAIRTEFRRIEAEEAKRA